MKKLIYVTGLLALLGWGCNSQPNNTVYTNAGSTPPNVVLIMADDMGYNDLGCYGNATIKTPNIDRLAALGMRLTDYHTNGVVCSPTRAALLTGLYPQEAGVEGVVTAKSHRASGMSPSKFTLAEYLKESGHTTALFGKWHLGYQPEFGPNVQGFDQFKGFVSGNVDYFSHIDQEGFEDWWNNNQIQNEAGYLTDLISKNAIEFLEKKEDDKPFFLYLAHGAPHYPYQGPNDTADRTVGGSFPIQGSREDKKKAYKEMIESLDKNVGKVIDYLDKNKLTDNTLVIFCSDNGGTRNVGSNAPLSGHKGQVYEGGHRVPAIFYWKDKIQPGVSEELVLSMDLFPTIASLLDLEVPKDLSGKDLSVIFDQTKADKNIEERTVFWRFKNQGAARKGNWKLLKIDGEAKLYNLSTDIKETADVKEEFPDVFQELNRAYEEWEFGLKEETILT
ncbi:sulfatase-like hydrolase/transferase [Cyclobacterium jeungdonense]|uniref:Sulfatase-like hydrolase/transferase n=1 Tax=Cyclobacterium jeungdonense TaxID=708087 RepID=A0ABT8C0M0_9BACT|nr:sulfatase-like hydrolase/transferase [Cyclobacterium jeungdonense]MDN3686231.1 sulfatase-like hydrolase/transferase [Cyclobacterium jeungdonense]